MEKYSLKNSTTRTENNRLFEKEIQSHFDLSTGTILDKLNNFPRFVSRQTLSVFLAKNELFKKIINVHGSIVECGVFMGGGLFTWLQLSSIYESVNHGRKIIGFDSFSGFPELVDKDFSGEQNEAAEHKEVGAYSFNNKQELDECVKLHDLNRSIGHIPKVELVEGDAVKEIPKYVIDNPHLVVSLLYLDFDLYEPTKAALQTFLPRMPKGSVIVFDELNQKQWPGETVAVLEEVGLNGIRIQRFSFTPSISYAVLE